MQSLKKSLFDLLHLGNPLIHLLLCLSHLAHLELVSVLLLECLIDFGLGFSVLEVALGLHHVRPGLLFTFPISDLVYLLGVN